MGTRVFSFDAVISTFHRQPEAHHASFSGRSLKNLRPSLHLQKLAIKCGGADKIEVKQKDEMKREDNNCDGMLMEEDNIIIISKEEEDVNEKVELMEMEAIMGKDDGKEPMDYKRRAGIFYKSSEMFQANKNPPHHHHCTQK
ncbi:hypothetical protein SSX86_018184 [Deinandra increscens subsp. villosa]|uniref:Uncharacterized protein n=1 Tax=Deinandra increscens subsp. villosa TaxID=3103831 RepID=A0AAP0GUJ5_9ASTR